MDIIALIGIFGGVIGIAGGVSTILSRTKLEGKAEGGSQGSIMVELGYLKSGIERIERKQDDQETKSLDILVRLAKVEDSAKSAHHRLDEIHAPRNGVKDA